MISLLRIREMGHLIVLAPGRDKSERDRVLQSQAAYPVTFLLKIPKMVILL